MSAFEEVIGLLISKMENERAFWFTSCDFQLTKEGTLQAEKIELPWKENCQKENFQRWKGAPPGKNGSAGNGE